MANNPPYTSQSNPVGATSIPRSTHVNPFDTDNDGVVDRAETADSVEWANVASKPSTFTPESHTHILGDITNTTTGGRRLVVTDSAGSAGELITSKYASMFYNSAGTFAQFYKNELLGTSDPGVGHDILSGWSVGSRWLNVSTGKEWLCVDNAGGAAVWKETTAGAGAAVASVFGRTGAVVAAASDYDASQVDNDSGVTGATVAAALDQLDSDLAAQRHIAQGSTIGAGTMAASTLNKRHSVTPGAADITITLPTSGTVVGDWLWFYISISGGGSVTFADDGAGTIYKTALSESCFAAFYNGTTWVSLAGDMESVTPGDLFVGTARGLAELPVGTDNYALVANSGANEGLSYVDLAARAETLTNKTINTASNTLTVVEADISDYDPASTAMARVAGSTYSTLQHAQDIFHSSGVTSGGGITDDTDGTITVAAGTGLIRATNSAVAQLLWTDWASEAGANVALTDNDMNYVYVEYNGGSPRVIATTTERSDYHTNVLLGTVYRAGTNLHITSGAAPVVGDHALQMIRRLNDLNEFARVSGAVLSEVSTRYLSVTAGSWWSGLTEVSTAAVNTSTGGSFTYAYRDGVGGWTEVAAQTQIDNTQYDDGSGTLATLTNNKYGVHWVYIEQDGDIYVVYGQGDYTLAEAESAAAPATIPPQMDESHGKLIGKVIVQKSATNCTSVVSAFQTILEISTAGDHSSLTNLSADDHTQYLRTDGTRQSTGDFTFANGATRTIEVAASGSGAGNALEVRAGDSDGTANGGSVTVEGGTDASGGFTGGGGIFGGGYGVTGGTAVFHGGDGDTTGGSATFRGGDAVTGGSVEVRGGDASGGTAGNVDVNGGDDGSGSGGTASMKGGTGGSGNGGATSVSGGDSNGYGSGGNLTLKAGDDTTATYGPGGDAYLYPGTGTADGDTIIGHNGSVAIGNVGIRNNSPAQALDVTGNIAVSGTVDGRDIATDGTKLDGIEAGADVTDAANVDAAGAVMNSDTSTASMSFVIDEDTMSSDSATKVPTQQSVKAYVDAAKLFEMVVAVSDETTALTTGTAKVTFRMPRAVTLTAVRASVTTAPTGSVLTVDINESGTTILSTKLTIDAGSKTSVGATTPAVISDSSLADDAEMTIDIDGVGSTVAGAGLKVTLIGTRA